MTLLTVSHPTRRDARRRPASSTSPPFAGAPATAPASRPPTARSTYAELGRAGSTWPRDVLGPDPATGADRGRQRHSTPWSAYLAASQHGHVVLLVPDRREPQLRATWSTAYDPDVVCAATAAGEPTQRRDGTAHDLHPDLALLLSTSGSTGSPKLVRLSHDNLRSNAAQHRRRTSA